MCIIVGTLVIGKWGFSDTGEASQAVTPAGSSSTLVSPNTVGTSEPVGTSSGSTTSESSGTSQASKETKQLKEMKQPEGKVVYLTFDDGPSRLTDEFLDTLKQHDVTATFFMQGSNLNVAGYHDEVKRAVDEGHYVGPHSMTHNYKKLYNQNEFVSEMKDTIDIIHNITGVKPKLVRAPYGSKPGLKDSLRNELAEAELKLWDWTIDSNDWKYTGNPGGIVNEVKTQTTEDVEIVLLHEKQQTLDALPEIIDFYKNKGYSFAVYKDEEHFPLNFWKDERL
ncbi:polysaccharide deacetylase [Paenibacillus sp. 481]|nr:polysaccharide deacetylase [Paenibacillus sp. 481]